MVHLILKVENVTNDPCSGFCQSGSHIIFQKSVNNFEIAHKHRLGCSTQVTLQEKSNLILYFHGKYDFIRFILR